MSSIRQLFD